MLSLPTDLNTSTDLVMTADIVTSYLTRNPVAADKLADLVSNVRTAINKLGIDIKSNADIAPVPAVPPQKSVFHDHIICLEDGVKKKVLKAYLRVKYGMTPEQYRSKWGLPSSYPMVAPAYTARRKEIAIQIGLGRRERLPDKIVESLDAELGSAKNSTKQSPQAHRRRRMKAA